MRIARYQSTDEAQEMVGKWVERECSRYNHCEIGRVLYVTSNDFCRVEWIFSNGPYGRVKVWENISDLYTLVDCQVKARLTRRNVDFIEWAPSRSVIQLVDIRTPNPEDGGSNPLRPAKLYVLKPGDPIVILDFEQGCSWGRYYEPEPGGDYIILPIDRGRHRKHAIKIRKSKETISQAFGETRGGWYAYMDITPTGYGGCPYEIRFYISCANQHMRFEAESYDGALALVDHFGNNGRALMARPGRVIGKACMEYGGIYEMVRRHLPNFTFRYLGENPGVARSFIYIEQGCTKVKDWYYTDAGLEKYRGSGGWQNDNYVRLA